VEYLGQINFNITAWVTQTAMGGKQLLVALYKPDFTLDLVKKSGRFSLNLLAEDQTKLIAKLGRKSGRDSDKLKNLAYQTDMDGLPFLTESVGYVSCRVLAWADGGDHELAICEVLSQKILHPEKKVLTLNYLREKKLIRG
jgi:flavin reductase (DIM6/NTAB) family NADH-FMN oxidoreductase RutF